MIGGAMVKSKWFEFDGRKFNSKRRAMNLNEAWDKTLEKWVLKMNGYETICLGSTCGLCNMYSCDYCPVTEAIGMNDCTPFLHYPDLEYLYLLIIKGASK